MTRSAEEPQERPDLRSAILALFEFEGSDQEAAVGIEVYGTGQPERLADAIVALAAQYPVPPQLRPDEAEHGHTFRITQTSRMSAGLWDEATGTTVDYRDADWWGPDERTVEVRAFDLPTALRLAAALPLTAWWPDLNEEPGT